MVTITHSHNIPSLHASDAVKELIADLSSAGPTPSTKSHLTVQISRGWKGKSNLSDLMKLMELSPFLSVSQRSQLLPKLLEQIILQPTADPSSCSLTDLCRGISGIRFFHSNNPQILCLVSHLASHLRCVLEATSAKRRDLNSIGLALSGLRNLKSEDPETLSLLESLAEAFKLSSKAHSDGSEDLTMDLDIVCQALSGLENSSSHQPPVTALVKLLADQLREPSRTGRALELIGSSSFPKESHSATVPVLSGKQIQIAAWGLKGLSSSHPECRELIGSLAGRLQTMRGGDSRLLSPLTASAAASLLSNLRHMDPADAVSPLLLLLAIPSVTDISQVVRKLLQRILSHLRCRESVEPLSPAQISAALSGLQKMKSEDQSIKQILEELFLNRLPDERWSARDICNALSGLQSMNATTGEMKRLLSYLGTEMKNLHSLKTKKNSANRVRPADSTYSLEMITKAFAGMGNMSSSAIEVQIIIQSLGEELDQILRKATPEGNSSQQQLLLHSIGLILGSMSNMCSHHDAVRSLMKKLAITLPKLNPITEVGSTQLSLRKDEWFTNILHGVKLLDSNHYEVRSLVRGLTPHLASSLEDPSLTLKAYHVVKILTGLRGLSNESFSGISVTDGVGIGGRGGHLQRGEPICDLLMVCVKAVEKCAEPISLSRLCGALSGLQSMQSGPVGHPTYSPELVQLIDSLVAKWNENSEITVRDCCQGLYGLLDVADFASDSVLLIKKTLLQHLTSRSRSLTPEMQLEVQRIVRFHSHRPAWLCSPVITEQLTDLQKISFANPISSIITSSSSSTTSSYDSSYPGSATTAASIPQKPKFSSLESSFFEDITQLFGMELRLLGASHFSPPTDPLAPLILRLRTLTQPSLHFKMRQNELIFGFESDFLLRIYRREDPSPSLSPSQSGSQEGLLSLVGVVNIEIDGPFHMPRHKKRFASLRDRYLRETYRQNTPELLFEIYRINIPDTRGDFSRLKRRSCLKEIVFADLVSKLEKKREEEA
jgi:hypothetical protein